MILALVLTMTPVVPAGRAFRCTPVALHDADGPLWCQEGPRLRLGAIAAREMDGTCRRGHPCPAMRPEEARRHVVGIMGGRITGTRSAGHLVIADARPLRCRSTGNALGNRTGAVCWLSSGQQFNSAVIASGAAAYWQRYDPTGVVRRGDRMEVVR